MNKNNEKIDTKKIIFEIIIIPLAIMYLYYTLLYNHTKINMVFLYTVTLITCIEFIVKYIHEVYVYKNKYNFFKILYIIVSFLLIISIFLNIFLKQEIVKNTFVLLLIVMLFHLLFFAIININRIVKNKGTLYKNTFASFFSLISFVVVLMGIIIFL